MGNNNSLFPLEQKLRGNFFFFLKSNHVELSHDIHCNEMSAQVTQQFEIDWTNSWTIQESLFNSGIGIQALCQKVPNLQVDENVKRIPDGSITVNLSHLFLT